MSLVNGSPTARVTPETDHRVVESQLPEADGEIDPGSQVLLTMPSMSTGLQDLPAAAAENLLVVSPWTPDRIESTLQETGVPVRNCGMIPLNGSPVRYDGPLWTSDAVAPADLTGLSMRYCEAMRHVEPGSGWVLLDNVQVLLMYAETRRVVRLLGRLVEQASERDATPVLAVDGAAVEMPTLARLNNLVTTVVER